MRADETFGLDLSAYQAVGDEGVLVPTTAGEAFAYTDGDEFEQGLYEFVCSISDRATLSMAVREGVCNWPSRYHLSPRRSNLLRPIASQLARAKVLEIGAGCGALTRYMGECGAQVLALEGSLARAKIAAARCDDLSNVCVVADTLQNLAPAPNFDYVLLVGVLEYARIFFPSSNERDPIDCMIEAAASFLAPGGRLVVAIENQLGLKYFAGYREDHTNEAMLGIEDRYAGDGVVTFGRRTLAANLSRAGLVSQEWLYPFPDYKLPVCVLSQQAVDMPEFCDFSPLLSASVLADPQVPDHFGFSLENVWGPIHRNGLAGELANSFLVIAGRTGDAVQLSRTLAWHYSVERHPAYAKSSEFVRQGDRVTVLQAKVREAGKGDANSDTDPRLRQVLDDPGFITGQWSQASLLRLLNIPGWSVDELAAWTSTWLQCVRETTACAGRALDERLDGRWIDAVPRNLMIGEGAASFFDLEWQWKPGISLGHLCYRAVVFSLMSVTSVASPRAGVPLDVLSLFRQIVSSQGLTGAVDIDSWHRDEADFQCVANGMNRWTPLSAIEAYGLPLRVGK